MTLRAFGLDDPGGMLALQVHVVLATQPDECVFSLVPSPSSPPGSSPPAPAHPSPALPPPSTSPLLLPQSHAASSRGAPAALPLSSESRGSLCTVSLRPSHLAKLRALYEVTARAAAAAPPTSSTQDGTEAVSQAPAAAAKEDAPASEKASAGKAPAPCVSPPAGSRPTSDHATRTKAGATETEDGVNDSLFRERVFSMLLRYRTLFGNGPKTRIRPPSPSSPLSLPLSSSHVTESEVASAKPPGIWAYSMAMPTCPPVCSGSSSRARTQHGQSHQRARTPRIGG